MSVNRHKSRILEQIEQHARSGPERPALVDRHGVVTYGRLWEEATSCADLLASRGVGARQPVGILLPNCVLFVAALLGAARAGRPAILFPTSLTGGELREYCEATGTRIVLAGPAYRTLLEAAGGRPLDQGRADLEISEVDVRSDIRLGPEDFIGQLTSGVDQPSKVALRTHAAVWGEIQDFAEEIGLTARDGVLVLTSIFHSYGLIGGTLAPLCSGARAVLGDRLAAEEVPRVVRTARPTIMFSVPVMYRALLAAAGAGDDFSSLRLCLSAGAPLPRDVDDGFAARYEKRICQDYGSTEAGVISLRLEWKPYLAGSVGRPLRHHTVTIVGARGESLGPGRTGEVIVRSPALARRYLAASPSGPTPLHGDCLATGDLGRLDEEGYLFLAGRKSSLIHTAAGTVDPADVETVIAGLPGVREVVVVGVPAGSLAERIKAVVAADGLTTARVLQHCRLHLADSHVPEIVEFCGTLPRTPAGKILRRALRTPMREGL